MRAKDRNAAPINRIIHVAQPTLAGVADAAEDNNGNGRADVIPGRKVRTNTQRQT